MPFDVNSVEKSKSKSVKELDIIAKKIKKRIIEVESAGNWPDAAALTEPLIKLSTEYRNIHESIIRIIKM